MKTRLACFILAVLCVLTLGCAGASAELFGTLTDVSGNRILTEPVSLCVGGLFSADASDNPSPARLRTGMIPLSDVVHVTLPEDFECLFFYYDSSGHFLKTGSWNAGPHVKIERSWTGAHWIRMILRCTDGREFTAADAVSLASAVDFQFSAYQSDGLLHDVPENEGVMNTLLKAKQLALLKWTTQAEMPVRPLSVGADESVPAGTAYTGMIYSSTRRESLYVPNNVSLHTFMTAAQNPNSVLYTRSLVNHVPNAGTYYGSVCSAYAEYCLGIPFNYTTFQWADIPGMRILENQSPQSVRLGDTLLRTTVNKGHVAMITDIIRDKNGVVSRISISESTLPTVISKSYSTEKFIRQWLEGDFTLYRYDAIHKSAYTPSEYVALPGEEPAEIIIPPLIPHRGDRSNYPQNETVIIDVLDRQDFTRVEILRDGRIISTQEPDDVITLNGLAPGLYTVRLSDGTRTGTPCSFIVASLNVQATPVNGGVRLYFESSENAVPIWLSWCDSDWISMHTEPITDAQRAVGYADTSYQSGPWQLKVAFETEYGIISSDYAVVLVP